MADNIRKELLETKKAQDGLNKALKDGIDLREKEQQLLKDGKTEREVQNELAKAQLEYQKNIVDLLNKLSNTYGQINGKIEIEAALSGEANDHHEYASKLIEKQLEQLDKVRAAQEAQLSNLIKQEEVRKRNQAAFDTSFKQTETSIAKLFSIDKQWQGTAIGNILTGFKDQTVISRLKGFGASILDQVSIFNLLGKAFLSVGPDLFLKKFEEQRAQFVAATGIAGKYDKALSEIGTQHISLGLNMESAKKSLETLREGYADFVGLSMEAQTETALFASKMDRLGISFNTSTKIMQSLSQISGQTAKQTEKTLMELYSLGTSIGTSPKKMAEDFEKSMPKLAAYGSKATQVFKEMSVAAKRTGLDVDRLLSIHEGFDTFEGAAEKVGKLNSILNGPYLDSIQMVTQTDPTKRMEMLKNAVSAAGKSFDSMSYYERKAIASAMGLSGVQELSQYMKGNMDDLNEATKKEALSQENLNKMLMDAIPLGQKFLDFFKSVAAVLEPLFAPLREFLSYIATALSWVSEKSKVAAAGMVVLLGVVAKLIFSSKALGGILTWLGNTTIGGLVKKLFGIGAASTAAATGQTVLGSASTAATPGVAAMGKAAGKTAISMVALGAALLGILFGISLVAKAFAGLTTGQMIGLAVILVIVFGGMALLVLVMGKLGVIGWAASAALLAVGTAIGIILFTLSKLIDSMTGFIKLLLESDKFTWTFIAKVAVLGLSMVALGAGAIVAALGLGVLAIGFMALAVPLALIKTRDLEAVATLFSSLSKIDSSTASYIKGITAALGELINTINKLPEEKTTKFRHMLDATKTIKETNVNNVRVLVDQVEKYKNASQASPTTTSQLATTSPGSSNFTTSAGSSTLRPIVLQLDGYTLKKFVIDVLNDQMNPKKI